jgi:predicted NAD/FAD-binding protein
MNRLQKIDPAVPLFVSLNPIVDPDPALVYRTFTYDHPQFDRAALGAQERLHEIQGQNRTWFCGAWTGHGFHEDGLKSGLEVAAHLGAPAPWGNQGHARIWRSPEAVAAE